MRRLVVASAILATLLTLPLAGVAAAPTRLSAAPTDSERATAALEYLLAAQRPDGSLDTSLGETADFVIGAAAAGYDPSTLVGCPDPGTGTAASALSYLAGASDAASADAAKTGKTILAVVAAGGDPASFAGRDLAARLAALYHSTTGAYGDGSTFSQSFAVLAVVASDGAAPAAALTELKALRDPDGSWSYGAAPVAAGEGDTNSTAIALMALDAAGDHTADAAGLAYLHAQQLADGGFPYQNSSTYGPPASDPDSDSIVLQALVAAGQDPEDSSWLQGADSVLTHLRAGQTASGGFAYPGHAANAFTTSQVPAALVRVPYAGAVRFTVGRRLPLECIGTPATGTPATTPTATASPTSSPTASPTSSPSVAQTPTLRPTAKPTPTPKPAAKPTVQRTPSPTPTESAGPTDTAMPRPPAPPASIPADDLATSDASGSTEQVAGVTFSPGDARPGPSEPSVPMPLLFGAAVLLGFVVVLGGGWLYVTRPWTR